jgi:hypothetical protein
MNFEERFTWGNRSENHQHFQIIVLCINNKVKNAQILGVKGD